MCESISSAIRYLESKESRIIETDFQKFANTVRQEIHCGKYSDLIKFPDKESVRIEKAREAKEKAQREKILKVRALMKAGHLKDDAAAMVGITWKAVRNYSKKFNISIDGIYKRREFERLNLAEKAKRLINEDGLNLLGASKKLEKSSTLISNTLYNAGYKYDRKTRRVSKIK